MLFGFLLVNRSGKSALSFCLALFLECRLDVIWWIVVIEVFYGTQWRNDVLRLEPAGGGTALGRHRLVRLGQGHLRQKVLLFA